MLLLKVALRTLNVLVSCLTKICHNGINMIIFLYLQCCFIIAWQWKCFFSYSKKLKTFVCSIFFFSLWLLDIVQPIPGHHLMTFCHGPLQHIQTQKLMFGFDILSIPSEKRPFGVCDWRPEPSLPMCKGLRPARSTILCFSLPLLLSFFLCLPKFRCVRHWLLMISGSWEQTTTVMMLYPTFAIGPGLLDKAFLALLYHLASTYLKCPHISIGVGLFTWVPTLNTLKCANTRRLTTRQ